MQYQDNGEHFPPKKHEKNEKSIIDLKLTIISHFSFLWHERSNLVKVKGQITITGLKKKTAALGSFIARNWSKRLLPKMCLCVGPDAEAWVGARGMWTFFNGTMHSPNCGWLRNPEPVSRWFILVYIHLKSPCLRCFRVTNSSTYMVIIYSHRLAPNTPSQQMM